MVKMNCAAMVAEATGGAAWASGVEAT